MTPVQYRDTLNRLLNFEEESTDDELQLSELLAPVLLSAEI